MSLVRSCWDVARAELLGCRSYGAIMMSLLRSYYDGAPTELLGWRSEGAYPIILVLYPWSMSVCSNLFR